MAERSWPFDGQSNGEDDWREMARQWLTSGMLYGEGNNLLPYADSTGMHVKVQSGSAWVRGHMYTSDAEIVWPIAASDPALSRTDIVVLRADFTANTVVQAVLTGTPGGGDPAVTQTTALWEIPVARVVIDPAAVSIAAGKVADQRVWARGNGGGPWGSFLAGWTATGTNPVLGNGTRSGRVSDRGSIVTAVYDFTFGSTTTYGTGDWQFALPKPANVPGTSRLTGSGYYLHGGLLVPLVALITASTVVKLANGPVLGGAASPVAWANGDQLHFTIAYEPAL